MKFKILRSCVDTEMSPYSLKTGSDYRILAVIKKKSTACCQLVFSSQAPDNI